MPFLERCSNSASTLKRVQVSRRCVDQRQGWTCIAVEGWGQGSGHLVPVALLLLHHIHDHEYHLRGRARVTLWGGRVRLALPLREVRSGLGSELQCCIWFGLGTL